MAASEKKVPPVVPAEDLVSEVESLLDLARKRGLEARGAQTPSRKARVFTSTPQKADIGEYLGEGLRQVLEAEVVPAVEEADDSGMFEHEVEREIQKKALVGLRIQTLRRLAATLGLDKRGRIEDLADRLARAYKYDEHAIAQLISENLDEPEPDRRFSERIFPLVNAPDIDGISERASWSLGRFIRVGIARWIAFESIENVDSDGLKVIGALHSYKAYLSTDDDEDVSLGSSPSFTPVALYFKRGVSTVRVENVGASAARAALKALEAVSNVRSLGGIPGMGGDGLEGVLGTFDRHTVFLLDLIYNRVPRAGGKKINLTAAKFRMSREELLEIENPEDDRPTLKAVRFEGRHLLDSVPACELIAEGRALVDISLTVGQALGSSDEEARFPCRFTLDRDHVAVMTGFGRIAGLAMDLHAALVQSAEQEIAHGILDNDRLQELAERIAVFSKADTSPDRPTMLD